MASNDDFELTEKYRNNIWAAKIHNNRKADKLKEKTEKNAASHASAIHHLGSSGTQSYSERRDPMCSEYSSAKLSIDDVHLFGHNPRIDDVILVMCWDCGKATKVQNLLSHIRDHHQSVEEYERKMDLSKKYAAYVACERQYMDRQEATVNCSKKRKKDSQLVVSDGFSEEKSKDLESQSNSFLSQNSPISYLPRECENSFTRSYSVKKRKKGLPQFNRSKSNKGKAKVSYQLQENVQNLSNSVYSEQSTSSVHRTEGVLFSYHTSPDSNHSVISGHSTLPGSTLYSSNNLRSIKQSTALDFQSKDRVQDNSTQLNYFHQSSASVLNKPIECSEQQPCINSLESNEMMRASSNQSFKQLSAKSLFPSSNEQDTEYTDHFLSIENKQPVKSPPRPCLETSISNNKQYESENSETFLVVNKESSALSICSSSNSPAGDSLSKNTSMEDKPKNKISTVHTPAVYCARLNMSINRIVQSPYVSIFRSDRSYRLRQALTKSIAEENARIREMKIKAAQDISRCGTESGYFSMSPKSTSEPSPISVVQSSSNFALQPSQNSALQLSPISSPQTSPISSPPSSPNSALLPSPISPPEPYLNSTTQQPVNSVSEAFPNSTSQPSLNSVSEPSMSPPCSAAQPSKNSLSQPSSFVCLIYDHEGKRQCSLTKSDLSKEPMKLFKNCSVGSKAATNSKFVDFGSVATSYLPKGLNIELQPSPYSVQSSLYSVPQPPSYSAPQLLTNSVLQPSQNSPLQDTKTVVNSQYVNLVSQTANSVVIELDTHRKYSNGCNNVVFINRKNSENNISKTNKCGVKKKQHV